MAAVQNVTTPQQARALAEHLLGSDRRLPSVVITTGAGVGEGLISASKVADEVGDLAEVWCMPTGDPTWEFKAAMPDMTQVFGEAARVYALDTEWQTNPYASRLYMCGSPARAARIEKDLVSDAMEAAGRAGLLPRKVATQRIVSGQVTGFTAGRALVRGDFGFGTIRPELTPGGVAIEQLVSKGMVISGRYDHKDKLIDVSDSFRTADEALSDYAVGDDVLVRVKTVGRAVLAVEMYPDRVVELRVAQVTGNDLDDLRDLLSVGEVVVARVDRIGAWILSMTDVEDDGPATACSLLPGGPPWLQERCEVELRSADLAADGHAEETAPEGRPAHLVATPPVSEPAPRAAPVPGPHAGEMARLQESVHRLERQAEAVAAEHAQTVRLLEAAEARQRRADVTIEQLRTRVRSLLKKSRRDDPAASRHDGEFISSEDQLRHDVYLAWAERIPAAEKVARPLPDTWVIGPSFCASVAGMKPEVRAKVPAVVVEILVGLAERSDAREMHPLRSSVAGDAPPFTRADGSVCWRVAVQRSSPSAARLHFWRRADLPIELSRVVVHDDMKP